jgi:hypothetical protein
MKYELLENFYALLDCIVNKITVSKSLSKRKILPRRIIEKEREENNETKKP